MGGDGEAEGAREGNDEAVVASASPRRVATLRSRKAPLAEAAAQLETLASLPLIAPGGGPASFEGELSRHGWDGLHPQTLEIFQINVGRLCNMSCRHCHVDAGPDRTDAVLRGQ